jgi:hypothetical protein
MRCFSPSNAEAILMLPQRRCQRGHGIMARDGPCNRR